MKKIFVIMIASLLLCPEARAATIEAARIEGSPVVTEQDVLTVGRIPDGVLDLFHRKGGRVLYVSSPLETRCGADYTVYGLYCPGSQKIYIRSGAETGGILAHELGHFLWHETRPSWPAEVRVAVTDPEEFAEAYSLCCRSGTTGRADLDAAIETINQTAEKLLRREKNAE